MVSSTTFTFAILQLAATISAHYIDKRSPNFDTGLDVFFEQSKVSVKAQADEVLWGGVQDSLKLIVPGITCTLVSNSNLTRRRVAPNEDCDAVEKGLVDLFPNIECEGNVSWEKLEKFEDLLEGKLEEAANELENGLEARQNLGDVDVEKARTQAQIKKEEQDAIAEAERKSHETITSCARATRPGNCRWCAAGYTVAAVAELGVCGAAAYGLLAGTGGTAASIVYKGFAACSVAVVATLGGNLTGCWNR